ncbi:phosphoribosylaminoimidazolesuccinocarboxamide synthase [candidate division WOR-3 bacterium RBG_13_43_14]|uniref:Phosphoribosylaminoimidazole-succinocarboxamide synthase n=1 Tax=candidate division WOR-3 bacterium RBG_13_43_14 TaxID=1802590 RepID=A0A1F4UA76_UNCW3|nr:MAG: phosphoribosylaminoimidazolesuccinocarboxamide synthase [candidate division WOR-3 bacterium RBG_13_43_14]
MGSVKDFKIIKPASVEEPGIGRFIFTDRYSVFDWGEMPDHIPNKGASIAMLSAYFFERLNELKIVSHYRGLVGDNKVRLLSEISEPTNVMEVTLVRVLKPELKADKYDYSIYQKEKGNFLIPLEVIYRNSLPPGSSVFKRLKEGQIKPSDLGFSQEPKPNQRLEKTILDVSTKLEITDRYLTWDEARQMAGMSDEELTELKAATNQINSFITAEFDKVGLVNEDGKIEVAYNRERKLMLVDVLGTLDECRFTYEGIPVSKEIARIYYRNTAWFKAVEEAKQKDRQNWKDICRLQPESLPPRLKELISQVYCACTNEITGRIWFKNVPALYKILKEINCYINF